jgi:type IV fimbrial biogenesis protein FimT
MRNRSSLNQRGVTLVEGVVVMLVVALFGLIAAPQITGIVVAQRLRAAATDLVSSLYLARSEAIKRNANVSVRPAVADDWTAGWIVAAAGGEQLDRRAGAGARVQISRAPEAIVYTPSGRLDPLGIARVELADAEHHPGVPSRCVIVDTAGVPRVEARECP